MFRKMKLKRKVREIVRRRDPRRVEERIATVRMALALIDRSIEEEAALVVDLEKELAVCLAYTLSDLKVSSAIRKVRRDEADALYTKLIEDPRQPANNVAELAVDLGVLWFKPILDRPIDEIADDEPYDPSHLRRGMEWFHYARGLDPDSWFAEVHEMVASYGELTEPNEVAELAFLGQECRGHTRRGGMGAVPEPLLARFDALATKLGTRIAAAGQIPELEQAIAIRDPRGRLDALEAEIGPALEPLYKNARTYRAKTEVQNVATSYALALATLAIQNGEPTRALLALENVRCRLIREQRALAPLTLPASISAELRRREAHQLTELLRAKDLARWSPDVAQAYEQAMTADIYRRLLDGILDEFPTDSESAAYVARRRGRALTWDEIKRWLAAHPRVAIAQLALLGSEVGWLDARDTWNEPRHVRVDGIAQWLDILQAYSGAINGRGDSAAMLARAGHLTQRLEAHLGGIEHAVIVPDSLNRMLPIHALDVGGQPLIVKRNVSYAPSIEIVVRDLGDAREIRTPTIFGDPNGNLPNAFHEAREVAARFRVPPIRRDQATRVRVLEALSTSDHVLLATHAVASDEDGLQSALQLSDGRLTAFDLSSARIRASSIVMSGCATGLVETRLESGILGLSDALLHAGVRTIIASQWPVDDRLARESIIAMYKSFEQTGCWITATREVAIARYRRDTTPRNWAAFTVTGAA